MGTREFTEEEIAAGGRQPPRAKTLEFKQEALYRVAAKFGVSTKAVLSKSRLKTVSRARHEWWRVLRQAGYSLHEIAAETGHDHTSVLAGTRPERDRRIDLEAWAAEVVARRTA